MAFKMTVTAPLAYRFAWARPPEPDSIMDMGTSATLARTDSRPVVKDARINVNALLESTRTKKIDDSDGPPRVPIRMGPPDLDSTMDREASTALARTDSRPDVSEVVEDPNQRKEASENMKTKVLSANTLATRMDDKVPTIDLSDNNTTSNL